MSEMKCGKYEYVEQISIKHDIPVRQYGDWNLSNLYYIYDNCFNLEV